jgi:hypothetical protein
MVLFDLNPPRGNISSVNAPQGQRVPELFAWLESIGPGLEALRVSLGKVLYPGESVESSPAATVGPGTRVSGNRMIGKRQAIKITQPNAQVEDNWMEGEDQDITL